MAQSDENGALRDRLRRHLIELVRAGRLATYKELAEYLGLKPPQTIHQLTRLLEILMAEDAAAGQPLLAAICVGRLRGNLPAPGFFLAAGTLGLFEGMPEEPRAREFHLRELGRLADFYNGPVKYFGAREG